MGDCENHVQEWRGSTNRTRLKRVKKFVRSWNALLFRSCFSMGAVGASIITNITFEDSQHSHSIIYLNIPQSDIGDYWASALQ